MNRNGGLQMRTYRKAFLIALVVNVGLAAGLGYLAWIVFLSHRASSPMPSAPPGNQSAPSTESRGAAAAVASAETKLAPVQLSPERLQGIGVRIGTVGLKDVQDDVRATGDVEVAEE